MKMDAKKTRWSRRYQAAAQKYLAQSPSSSLRPGLALGRQAVTLGLKPLDIAKIHEEGLATLELSNRREEFLKR